jgi:hypothetical protein
MERHRLEVLHNSGKVKLIAGAGRPLNRMRSKPWWVLRVSKASLHHARIHREPLAFEKARCHPGCNQALEVMTENLALTEAAEPVHPER